VREGCDKENNIPPLPTKSGQVCQHVTITIGADRSIPLSFFNIIEFQLILSDLQGLEPISEQLHVIFFNKLSDLIFIVHTMP
jgi:hypothetical protein